MSTKVRDKALGLGTLQHFAPGDVLLLEGAPSDSAVLLLAGLFKVVGSLGSGREALVAIRIGGDIVGELGLADGGPRSATVKAAGSGVGRRIGKREYYAFLDRFPDARRAVDRAVATKLRSATRRRVEFTTYPAAARMARVLLEFMTAHGTRKPEGVMIEVALTQPELAALVGVAEPTAQRMLASMRHEHVLDTRYRRILVLDEQRLEQFAQP